MDANQKEIMLKKINNHQFSKTEISDKTIKSLQTKMGWHGIGTESDPIIIQDITGLKPNLWIHRSSLHYVIRDIAFYKLICINSQNIVIEGCKIHELEVEGCYNIAIRNNSIIYLKFLYSKGCNLQNNSFSSEALEKLENNYFDNLYPSIQKGIFYLAFAPFIMASIIMIYNINLWFLSLMYIGLGILLFYYVHTLNFKKRRTQDKPDNMILASNVISNDDEVKILSEILEYFSKLKRNWFRKY